MSEIDDIRTILASTDVGSLPDDYPTVRMAADRMATLNERTLEGLALIGKLEQAAARIEKLEAALRAWESAVRVDVLMEGPRYMGVSGEAGRRAWELTRTVLEDRE